MIKPHAADTSMAPAADATDERSERILKAVKGHVFLSIMQHMITLQSEPELITRLSGGDPAATMRTLANSQGLMSLLSLVLNQTGGRLSDVTGRKAGLLLGPVLNVLLGVVVFGNASKRSVVVACRILRMIVTSFSNTVMVQACLLDALPGKRLGSAMSELAAYIGGAVVVTPMVESLLFKLSGRNPAVTYLGLSALAAANLAVTLNNVPETLPAEKRKPMSEALTPAVCNPFGFVKLYTHGSAALRRMVNITTLQMTLEGKNTSDLVQTWCRQHLLWRPEATRNFIMGYGVLCMVAGINITPRLLRAFSARDFTSVTNATNGLAFFLRGARPSSALWVLAVAPLLPGVNGASANALKAIVGRRAAAEGFGAGEFSAYSNNLRALAGALAPVLYGNVYAAAKRRGLNPGVAFWAAGLLGAALPQLLLNSMRDEELTDRPPDDTDGGDGGGGGGGGGGDTAEEHEEASM